MDKFQVHVINICISKFGMDNVYLIIIFSATVEYQKRMFWNKNSIQPLLINKKRIICQICSYW